MPNAHSYEVLLTPEAEQAYINVSSKVDLKQLDAMLDVLDTVPGIGRLYDPIYPAARPDIDNLQVVFAGHYGVYYVVDEQNKRVMVLAIEDQRRDPLARFPFLVEGDEYDSPDAS